jgi:hypothetical protein
MGVGRRSGPSIGGILLSSGKGILLSSGLKGGILLSSGPNGGGGLLSESGPGDPGKSSSLKYFFIKKYSNDAFEKCVSHLQYIYNFDCLIDDESHFMQQRKFVRLTHQESQSGIYIQQNADFLSFLFL